MIVGGLHSPYSVPFRQSWSSLFSAEECVSTGPCDFCIASRKAVAVLAEKQKTP